MKRRTSGACALSPACRRNALSHSLKEKRKEAEDALLVEEIRELQQRHFYSLGYRKVSATHKREINAKRVRRLMREHNLLSRVRRRKYSEEVYATRRAVRKMKIPDLVSRCFFSSLPPSEPTACRASWKAC